ncbi:MAG: NAD(P)H-dependent oxidoreductase subunit E, partial [Halobacteria archaeon]|nr:NAD(P)H-dependent oxidoreductase subunit E [Halobacteria archaeon]
MAGENKLDSKIQLISEPSRAEIDRWIEKYPEEQKRSAVMAALRIVQDQNNGYLTNDLMDAVAEYLDMPSIAVYEVATFYSMYELEPVGRHKICICTNISCMLCGSDNIVGHLTQQLGIK